MTWKKEQRRAPVENGRRRIGRLRDGGFEDSSCLGLSYRKEVWLELAGETSQVES